MLSSLASGLERSRHHVRIVRFAMRIMLTAALIVGIPAVSYEAETPAGATGEAPATGRSTHLTMSQAMADIHSADVAATARARRVLDDADLSPEQRRFAELVRHPEISQRLELVQLLKKSSDAGSKRAILEFLKTSDPESKVRKAAKEALLPTLPLPPVATNPPRLSKPAAFQTPKKTAKDKSVRSAIEQRYLVDQTESAPKQSIELQVKRATYLRFKQAPVRDEVTDEEVLDVQQVGPNEYRVFAKASGASVLSFWFENPEVPGKLDVLSYLVRVLSDPEEDERMRTLLRNLERDLNRTFPNSSVQLSYVGQQVVIRGQAKDVEEATHISRIVSRSLPRDESQCLVFHSWSAQHDERLGVSLISSQGLMRLNTVRKMHKATPCDT